MHFYITLWAHWLIIQLQSLYTSSLKSLTSLLHSSWLGSYLHHLITSYLEKCFPASSNIFQHTSPYPYKQYSHITNSPTDLNPLSTNTSSLRESPSDANKKFSGALVPYHNGHQENSLTIDGTLYGYEPFKWRAKTKYMRISRSFKPIEVIRKRRVYLRHYNHDIIMAPRDAKRILKYCTNGCMDLTYRFVYPSSVSKVSLAKEYLIYSPLVSHIEFFIDSHSEKAAKDIVFHQLKRLKKVKGCFVLLGALNSLKFLNKWKTLESLRIKCGTEWTLRHWEFLKQVLRPNINALSLNVRLMIESIKGPEYLQCLEKIYKSSIETLNLKLELQSEYIIDYLFIRCLCMSKVKNLHLRCTGNTVMTDHGVLTYEFQGLLNHLIPRSLGTMGSLTKLKLDFSNDFFVYYRMEDYQLVELCDAIQELPQLVFLDLNVSNGCERANHVADSTLIYLEESLQKLAKLQVLKLNISNTYITFGGLERLCKFAMRLNNLHYFKVNASRNSIDKKKLEEALFSVKDQIVIYCDIIV